MMDAEIRERLAKLEADLAEIKNTVHWLKKTVIEHAMNEPEDDEAGSGLRLYDSAVELIEPDPKTGILVVDLSKRKDDRGS